MKSAQKVCFFMIVAAGSALAQSRMVDGPLPAVSGPAYDVSVGYSHLTMAIPSAGHVNLEGLDATGSVALSPRWGAMVESGFARTSDVLSTSHQGYMLSLHAGPVFHVLDRGNTRVFVHALGGAALVDGAVPINQTQFFGGWLLRPSYAVGGGVEHALSDALAVRVKGDYLHTTFYGSNGATQPQNNLRLTVSLVFRLRERQHRPDGRVR